MQRDKNLETEKVTEKYFPQNFLFALKLVKKTDNGAQNEIFVSFHKILSLFVAETTLKWRHCNSLFYRLNCISGKFKMKVKMISSNEITGIYDQISLEVCIIPGSIFFLFFAWRYLARKVGMWGYCFWFGVFRRAQPCSGLTRLTESSFG